MESSKKVIVAVILISFAASVVYSFYFQIAPAVDAAAYDNIAWNLVQGGGYKENASLSYDEDIAILRVGPGYQFFLAGIYFIFGRNYHVVWVINAVLHALSALFVWFLSREIFRNSWSPFLGAASAVLVGFSPDLITMSGMLMTETLAVFLIAAASFIFFKYINSASRPVYLVILFSAVFGFAVMTRTPAALLALPVLYHFFINKQWQNILVLGVVLTVLFSPWVIRNYSIYSAFIPTNYAFGYDLLIGNHPGATGELEPYEPAERYIREYGRVEGNELAFKEALNFVVSRPVEFAQITLQRISIYFSVARPTGFWFHLEGASRIITLILSAVYSALLFGLGFWGIYRIKELSEEEKKRAKRLFWLTLTMPLAVIFIIIETRYRFLAYPLLAVFAGFGFADLFRQKSDFKPLIAIYGILFLNGAIDGLRNLNRVTERLKDLL